MRFCQGFLWRCRPWRAAVAGPRQDKRLGAARFLLVKAAPGIIGEEVHDQDRVAAVVHEAAQAAQERGLRAVRRDVEADEVRAGLAVLLWYSELRVSSVTAAIPG